MSIFGTGFGQTNQQQQQQQQQPQQNAFGQPSAFGSTGFGAFGQNNQQQQQQPQPQANPMFGNLASAPANPSGGGFGAFGSASNTTSAFGQPKPAFGSAQPSAFGSGGGSGAFGGASTGGGIFGQQAAQPQQQPQQANAFSSGGGLFAKPAGTGFGEGTALAPAQPMAGSSNPPYQEFQEREGGNLSTMLHYQSISCMPAYRNASFEELRVQDYQQGRKTANSFGPSAPTAFGQPAQQQPATGLFGQPAGGGTFGQQQQPSQPAGGFGAFAQQPQQQQPSSFGAFGQPQTQSQPAAGGFGSFAQPQQNQQQPAGSFGSFGVQQQPQQTSGFGSFGQQNQQNKPFSSFGQTQPATSGFSAFSSNTGANTAAGGGSSLFSGQPQQQQQQQSSPFSSFGQQNTQQNQQSGNPLLKPSVFGQPSTGGGLFGNTGQQQQGGGLFGLPAGQQQTQQPQQGGGLFGQPSGGTGAFGQPAQPAQQPGLFGQPAATSGGLFGNTSQQQNQPQQTQQAPGTGFGSLFSKPPGGGLFGNTGTTAQNQPQNPNPANPLFGGGGGLFGGANNQQQQQQPSNPNPLFGGANTGSLFSGKPPAPAPGFGALGGGGLFGNNNQQQPQTQGIGGGIFGASNNQQQPQQSLPFGGSQQQSQTLLTPLIDQPFPASALNSLPPLPSLAASLSPKKKTNVFATVAARSSPRLGLNIGLNYTPPGPGSKLRGFGFGASVSAANPFSLPAPGSPGKSGLGLGDSRSLLSPDAFSNGPNGTLQLLGGRRQSVKKLVLDKHVDEEELRRMRGMHSTSPERGREVRFSPILSLAARERDNLNSTSPPPAANPTRNVPRPASRLNDTSTGKPDGAASSDAILDPKEGEYWCLPPVAELQQLSFGELRAVKDFTVGRVGYGTIQFLQPVDLTSVSAIAGIPGKIITFEHVECMLYPDERHKASPGEGLNVPARIKLDRCWAMNKSTREPIKDENDPKHQQRLRKMKNHDGAEFVSFDMETGVWEFIVQEF